MKKIIKTEILNEDVNSIKRASYFLNNDELVSFPTETVYGLGASAISNSGVGKIFSVKGRPTYNPLIVHIASAQEIYNWAQVSREAEILIENFWPGPLTLVLNRKDVAPKLASLVTANLETVAIRVPMHTTARALISEFGFPIAAPSANISGRVSPTRAKDVLSNMNGKISALIKGDNCAVGVESTIISLAGNNPIVLRPGGVPTEILEEKLGRPILKNKKLSAKDPKITSPGMMNSHYAPNCRLNLNQETPPKGALFLGFGNMPKNITGLNLSSNGDLEEAACNLFAALTDIDAMASLMKLETISVAPIPNIGLGVAINDRLKRAAAPKN